MSAPIRVLVIDDSALMRQMISRFLTEAGMNVIATARDGVDGLEKIAALKPDVVTLDVEMPRMNGLDMLRQLMEEDPRPVVMVSSVTQAQTPAAVEALMLGAVDVVAKPGGAISLNLDEVQAEIVTKVRTAAGVTVRPRRTRRSHVAEQTGRQRLIGREQVPSRPVMTGSGKVAGPGPVIIGSSTGGPGALSTVLGDLGADFPRPIVIVQHMPAGFTASLAKRLNSLSALDVAEVQAGVAPQPGEAWVAPGGMHVVFDERGRFVHSDAPPHLGVRPAVDLTLESAVHIWGGDVIAVILTGMGVDGARGARALKRAGGYVLAQDRQTSIVYGMPRAVTELGLTDAEHPLQDLAAAMSGAARAVATRAH